MAGPGNGPAAVVTDGRVANRLRNREKLIDAYVALVQEGQVGSVDQIIERSGVARRSIFRHFADLPDLRLAAFRRVVADAAADAELANLGVGPLDRRIDALVVSRLRTLERTHPFGVLARSRLAEHEEVRIGISVTTDMLRTRMARHFERELAGRSPAEVNRRLDALYVVVSFESYDVLIHQLGRPVDVVTSTWTESIRAILTN